MGRKKEISKLQEKEISKLQKRKNAVKGKEGLREKSKVKRIKRGKKETKFSETNRKSIPREIDKRKVRQTEQ